MCISVLWWDQAGLTCWSRSQDQMWRDAQKSWSGIWKKLKWILVRIIKKKQICFKRFLSGQSNKIVCFVAVDAEIIARGTVGFSGAELENLVNQAALKAAADGKDLVTMKELEFAKDKILMGEASRDVQLSLCNMWWGLMLWSRDSFLTFSSLSVQAQSAGVWRLTREIRWSQPIMSLDML